MESATAVAAGPGVEEVLDRLRLAAAEGLSPRLQARLLRRLGSAVAALRAVPAAVAEVPGFGDARAVHLASAPGRDAARRDLERAHAAGARVLVEGHPDWPRAFAELDDPPLVLFVRGDVGEPDRRGVAVVGSRRASPYGLSRARQLRAELAALGVTVVSGLARGIDAAAHRGALDGGGRTVGVLGGGMARFYPAENRPLAREIADGRGAVISEFPLDVPPRQRAPAAGPERGSPGAAAGCDGRPETARASPNAADFAATPPGEPRTALRDPPGSPAASCGAAAPGVGG